MYAIIRNRYIMEQVEISGNRASSVGHITVIVSFSAHVLASYDQCIIIYSDGPVIWCVNFFYIPA